MKIEEKNVCKFRSISLPRMHFLSLFHHFIFMICDWGSPSFLCRRTMIGVFFFILVTLDLTVKEIEIVAIIGAMKRQCHL
jgi:hypothetical protein